MVLVASFIWCLACSASNLLKCILLSYHIIGVNMSRYPVFRHIPSSYHVFAFHPSSVRQYHAWMSSEERIVFLFIIGLTSQCKINTAEGNWYGNGWWWSFGATQIECLYRFYSAILPTRFARQHKARQSTSLCRWWEHLPYSTITGACSNLHYYMWFHVAYDFYLVLLLTLSNCICLLYT